MAHCRQKRRPGLVGDLGLAQRNAQRALGFEFFGDVLDRTFVAEQRP